MANCTCVAHRMVIAGGFAIVASAALLLSAPGGPAGPPPALASCLPDEILNTANGVCEPAGQGVIGPEYAGGLTDNGGSLEEVDGIPCTGANTGKCIGLQESAR